MVYLRQGQTRSKAPYLSHAVIGIMTSQYQEDSTVAPSPSSAKTPVAPPAGIRGAKSSGTHITGPKLTP